jgi:hypothetical protein
VGIFGRDKAPTPVKQGALAQAATSADEGGIAGFATDLVEKVLDVGMDGRGPFASAEEVARDAQANAASEKGAIDAIVRKHVALGAAGGFVTGLGGFITMPIALPANVIELLHAQPRGWSRPSPRCVATTSSTPQIRSAVLLTLVGADADDLLAQGRCGRDCLNGWAADGNLAAERLPGPALMIINKAHRFPARVAGWPHCAEPLWQGGPGDRWRYRGGVGCLPAQADCRQRGQGIPECDPGGAVVTMLQRRVRQES